jgi:hypothetical protein
MEKTFYGREDGLAIGHIKEQGKMSEGDISFDAEADVDSFNLWLAEYRGRDRDNYDYSHEAEIKLDREEATELLLALTVWLERQEASNA